MVSETDELIAAVKAGVNDKKLRVKIYMQLRYIHMTPTEIREELANGKGTCCKSQDPAQQA